MLLAFLHAPMYVMNKLNHSILFFLGKGGGRGVEGDGGGWFGFVYFC